jgi:uncharacterized protein (TIRG00374 family)
VAFILRSLRWRVLLSAEKKVAPLTVFWATMAGYLGNNFLPARAGEVIRSAALGHKAGLSKSWVFATALTERLLDVIALILISLAALLVTGRLSAATSSAAGQSAWLARAWKILGIIGLLGLLTAIVLPRLEGWLRRALGRLPLPAGLHDKLLGVLTQFLLGMRAFQNWARATRFTGFTLATWLTDGLGSVLCAKALGLSMSLPVALVFLAAIGLSSAAPSTPGYVGIYQFVAVTVLPPFGFTRTSALTFIIVAQGLSYLVVTVWGLVGLWRLQISPAGLRQPSGTEGS